MKRLLCMLLIGTVLAASTGCDELLILEQFVPGYSEFYYYPGESCCEYVVETYKQEETWVEEVYYDEVWIEDDGYWWP